MATAFTIDGQIKVDIDKVIKGLDDVSKSSKQTKDELDKSDEKAKGFNDTLKGMAQTAIGYAGISQVKDFVTGCVENTKELREDMSKLRTVADNTNNTWDDVNEQFKEFNAVSGETDSSVEALNNLMNTGLSGSQLAQAVDDLSGAVVAFPDTLKIESLADSLQETVATGSATGQFSELLGRCGVNIDNFNEQLGACSNQNERLNVAMETLNNTGMTEIGNKWKEQNKDLIENSNAQISYQQALANLGQTLTPIITKITEFATKLIEWFNGLSDGQKLFTGIVIGVIAIIPTLISLISGIVTIVTTLNITTLACPVTWIIASIIAIIAIGVLLYTHWDTIKQKCSELWEWVKAKFQGFTDWLGSIFTTDWSSKLGIIGDVVNSVLANISNYVDAIKRVFSGIIDFVAGVFTGDWSRAWEGVKNIFGGIMDGLSAVMKTPLNAVIGLINGAISGLNKIKVNIPNWVPGGLGGKSFGINIPKISYLENGGILTQPTMLNANVMAGEKNKGRQSQNEAVIPLDKLYKMIDDLSNRPVEVALRVDGKELTRAIAPYQKEFTRYSYGR